MSLAASVCQLISYWGWQQNRNLGSKLMILDALLSRVKYTHYAVVTCVALCLPDLHKSGRSASCMYCAQLHEACSCVFEFVLLAGRSAQLHSAARQKRNNLALCACCCGARALLCAPQYMAVLGLRLSCTALWCVRHQVYQHVCLVVQGHHGVHHAAADGCCGTHSVEDLSHSQVCHSE